MTRTGRHTHTTYLHAAAHFEVLRTQSWMMITNNVIDTKIPRPDHGFAINRAEHDLFCSFPCSHVTHAMRRARLTLLSCESNRIYAIVIAPSSTQASAAALLNFTISLTHKNHTHTRNRLPPCLCACVCVHFSREMVPTHWPPGLTTRCSGIVWRSSADSCTPRPARTPC